MRLRHLIIFAICLHIAITAGVYLAAKHSVAPNTVGDGGIASFASDGRVYQLQIDALDQTLKQDGIGVWLRTSAPVHVKLYSLSYSAFSPLFGRTVLSVEPLNLLYYVVTLLLVFALGREAFGAKAGLVAASMYVLFMPSFLLHTTQLLKDPLFVVVTLVLIFISLKWITTEYTLLSGILAGVMGGAAGAGLWLIKHSAWWVVLAIMVLGLALSIASQIQRRLLLTGNIAGVAVMLGIALAVSYIVTPYYLPKEYWAPHRRDDSKTMPSASAEFNNEELAVKSVEGFSGPGKSVALARARFSLYPNARSNIDSDVRFASTPDILRYIPRAFVVGMFAPFPNMWFSSGDQVGTAGRLLSGCETLVMYVVQMLAATTLWVRRRHLPAWLLVMTSLIGVVALGLVVVNVGALYRQRFLFWIVFIIVAADAVTRLVRSRWPAYFGEYSTPVLARSDA